VDVGLSLGLLSQYFFCCLLFWGQCSDLSKFFLSCADVPDNRKLLQNERQHVRRKKSSIQEDKESEKFLCWIPQERNGASHVILRWDGRAHAPITA